MSMEKLYAYADETGQDTAGGFFLVAVVVVGSERDQLLRWLAEVEKETAKGLVPWHKSQHDLGRHPKPAIDRHLKTGHRG